MNIHFKNIRKKIEIYCDMDGVLVDFETGANRHFLKNKHYKFFDEKWKTVRNDIDQKQRFEILGHPKIWEEFPPMRDYKLLWNFIVPFRPNILSATPITKRKEVKNGKISWLKKHIKSHQIGNIHIVMRNQKRDYATHPDGKICILIDDYHKNIEEWTNSGGVSIKHSSAKETISQLKKILKHL